MDIMLKLKKLFLFLSHSKKFTFSYSNLIFNYFSLLINIFIAFPVIAKISQRIKPTIPRPLNASN